MACIFMLRVTLSFIRLSQNTCNFDLLEIRRNSTMYLDFARRTERYVLRRHPRSREIPRFATRVYHFTLSGVSQSLCVATEFSQGWVVPVATEGDARAHDRADRSHSTHNSAHSTHSTHATGARQARQGLCHDRDFSITTDLSSSQQCTLLCTV